MIIDQSIKIKNSLVIVTLEMQDIAPVSETGKVTFERDWNCDRGFLIPSFQCIAAEMFLFWLSGAIQ